MKAKSNKTVWITVAAVVVIAAVIRLYNNQNTSDDVLFTDFIRSLLHIGLIRHGAFPYTNEWFKSRHGTICAALPF